MKRGLNMSLAEAEAHQLKHFGKAISGAPVAPVAASESKYGAKQPNKTEAAFGLILEARKQRGEIAEYVFEPISLRYGHRAFYKPDWVSRHPDCQVSMAELISICEAPAIDAATDGKLLDAIRELEMVSSVFAPFTVYEVKGGRIYPEAKPRFKAARLRHPWADFQLHQKKGGTWTRLF